MINLRGTKQNGTCSREAEASFAAGQRELASGRWNTCGWPTLYEHTINRVFMLYALHCTATLISRAGPGRTGCDGTGPDRKGKERRAERTFADAGLRPVVRVDAAPLVGEHHLEALLDRRVWAQITAPPQECECVRTTLDKGTDTQ